MKNREVHIRRGSRFLCRVHGIQTMDHQDENDQVFLECRCKRTPGLLDPTPGHLSFEAVMAGDPLALSLFRPVDHDGFRGRGRDITDVIDDIGMQAQRERWAEAA